MFTAQIIMMAALVYRTYKEVSKDETETNDKN